jgi:hypothetical protein
MFLPWSQFGIYTTTANPIALKSKPLCGPSFVGAATTPIAPEAHRAATLPYNQKQV